MNKKLTIGLMSVLVAAGLVGSASAQTPDDLVLHAEYLFEPGAADQDTSGNGFHILPDMGPGTTLGEVEGFESGGAYHGDIGEYDDSIDQYENQPTAVIPAAAWPSRVDAGDDGSFTIEMMLWLDEEWDTSCGGGGPDPYGHAEGDSWGDGSNGGWFTQFAFNTDSYWFQWEYGGYGCDGLGQDEYSVNSSFWKNLTSWNNGRVLLPMETWHQWVVSFDGSVGRLFWDGELLETLDQGSVMIEDVPDIDLGSMGGSDPWRGRIDNFRFYKGYTTVAPPVVGGLVKIAETDGSTRVREAGETTDSFTVVLDRQPVSNVTITIDPPTDDISLNAEAVNDAVTLVFTSANWDAPQAVMVKANDDGDVEGPETIKPSISVETSDPELAGAGAPALKVRVYDNDSADVFISPLAGVVTTEDGATGSYTVQLEAAPSPSENVVVKILDGGEPNQVTVNGDADGPVEITFVPGSWDTPQTVTVKAIDDDVAEVNPHETTLSHSAVGGGYSGLEVDAVVVTIEENDCGGGPFFAQDHNQDCSVTLEDFVMWVQEFLSCSIATCQ